MKQQNWKNPPRWVVGALLAASLPMRMAWGEATGHVWEKIEITLHAQQQYPNPYTAVVVWVDLEGPNFKKRVYGFWDSGQTFRVRLVATAPGTWRWWSGATPADNGLTGKSGTFEAVDWTEAEKQANPLRRGFLRSTANHHALEQADGTPFFAIGDTWWSLGSNRFRWYDDAVERPLGPTAGFKDYVRYRKAQGFNWINMITAFPSWMTDGQPWRVNLTDPERTTVRSAWLEFGADSAKNMDNEGGRPFFFPGKVPGYANMYPDVNRINPAYFHYIDRKVDYLNEQGFVPFIEVTRRDASPCWKKYYDWPESYARFIQYVWSRYQANNAVLSPIHLDTLNESIPPKDYQAAISMVMEKFGPPPFGTLLSANANPSTYENWGEDSWVTLHQIGNMRARTHDSYWYLTEIFRSPHPQPALNGEPYYAGYNDARASKSASKKSGYKYGATGGTEQDAQFVRSSMYGCFLSGGLAGHVYGAEGIWGGDIELVAPVRMWDAFQWSSGAQMQHLRTFAFSIGRRYEDLVPDTDMVSPNKIAELHSHEGWAYCARTPDKEIFLLYFEKGCAVSLVRGAKLQSVYRAQWFDPRTATWQDAGNGKLKSNESGVITLPAFPTDTDWALRLSFLPSFSGTVVWTQK